jgi:hypothetical protein
MKVGDNLKVQKTPRSELDFFAALRVEWLKARARRDRWMEEVELLSAELVRTATFFDNKADWWTSLLDKQSEVSPELYDGLRAYAARQADFQCQHARHVRSQHQSALAVCSPDCQPVLSSSVR